MFFSSVFLSYTGNLVPWMLDHDVHCTASFGCARITIGSCFLFSVLDGLDTVSGFIHRGTFYMIV